MNDQKAERIGPFILKETLGEGMTGKVKRALHNKTNQEVAIKIINKSKLTNTPNLRRKVEREIAVMKLIKHPNLIKLHDVLQTRKYLFLIIEYVEGGELFEYIVQHGRLSEEEAFKFFKQILEGVEYCHNNLICHRDLKPENLLLDKNLNIKIADFGMASLMSEDFLVATSCGSPHYASPEVVSGGKYNGMMADIWSCGVILFALLAGTLPFDDDNVSVLLGKVKKGVFKMPTHFPDDVKDLILNMLSVDVNKRISLQRIKRHPWWLRMEAAEAKIHQEVKTVTPPPQRQGSQQIETQLIDLSTDDNQGPESTTSQFIGGVNGGPVSANEIPTSSNQSVSGYGNELPGISEASQGGVSSHNDSQPSDGEENENHSITNVDENVINILISMGWQDRDKLIEKLQSGDKNIETVTYKLVEQNPLQESKDDFGINPKLRVSMTNPLTEPVEPLEIMRRMIIESEKLQQEHEKNQEKKQSFLSKIFKSKKKAENLAVFEVETDKDENEAFNDLTRNLNELKIGVKKSGTNTMQATCTENPVVFEISIGKREDGQNMIRFVVMKGNPYTARAIVQVVREQMQGE